MLNSILHEIGYIIVHFYSIWMFFSLVLSAAALWKLANILFNQAKLAEARFAFRAAVTNLGLAFSLLGLKFILS